MGPVQVGALNEQMCPGHSDKWTGRCPMEKLPAHGSDNKPALMVQFPLMRHAICMRQLICLLALTSRTAVHSNANRPCQELILIPAVYRKEEGAVLADSKTMSG